MLPVFKDVLRRPSGAEHVVGGFVEVVGQCFEVAVGEACEARGGVLLVRFNG